MGVVFVGPSIGEIAKNTGEWVKRATVRIALEELRVEVDRGFDNRPVVITDGMPRRAPDQVKPFGKIIFAARPNMAEVVQWALTELQKRSPFLRGDYVRSHTVMINNHEIRGNIWAALRAIKETDRVQIVNQVPYARKIEGRKSRSRGSGANKVKSIAVDGQSPQAPRGVYERVVLPLLVRRYGRSMFFDFKYVKLNSGLKAKGLSGGGRRANSTAQTIMGDYKRSRILRDVVYPSLHFFIKPTGLAN